jgi:hypothetical protein
MADVHTPEQRSFNMSRIKSRNTKPEMLVRKFLHTHGFRYRLHVKDLPGKPDIVLQNIRPSFLYTVVSGTGMKAEESVQSNIRIVVILFDIFSAGVFLHDV